jgi:hypothetical protein
MSAPPPTDPRIRGFCDGLAEAIAEQLLRELAEGCAQSSCSSNPDKEEADG